MEEEYLDSIKDIKDNLSDMTSYTSNEYKKEAKSLLFIIGIPTVAIVILLVLGIFSFNNYMKKRDEINFKKSLKWQQENYAVADELYEAKDFDALIDYIDSSVAGLPYEVASYGYWEHYDFTTAYRLYRFVMNAEVFEDDPEFILDGTKEFVFPDALALCFDPWEVKLDMGRINKSEYELIKGYQDEIREYMRVHFGIDNLDELKDECLYDPPGVGTDYTKCKELSKRYEWIF